MDTRMNHFDGAGNAIMVDVSGKTPTARTAVAAGRIVVGPDVMRAVRTGTVGKGDVLGVARVAGIMAVKRTWELIPMCHPLGITGCAVDFELLEEESAIRAVCTARVGGQTGVEMEALTGVSVALLTVYDMCKAIDKTMHIEDIHLLYKEGGKSGVFRSEDRHD